MTNFTTTWKHPLAWHEAVFNLCLGRGMGVVAAAQASIALSDMSEEDALDIYLLIQAAKRMESAANKELGR